jgi:hypothetical protein
MKFFLSFLLLFFPLCAEEVVFVSFHPGPTEHFKEFAAVLREEKISCLLLGGEPSLRIWKEGVFVDKKEEGMAKLIQECAQAKVVITDSDPFCAKLHEQLHDKSPFARRLVYYDNPEPFVPGGYSENIARIVEAPIAGMIFANFHLAETPILKKPRVDIEWGSKKRYGLGYYPLSDVEMIKKNREKRVKNKRLTLLYLGGANQDYYERVIPHFVKTLLLADLLENVQIVFQQHPRAKLEGNPDLNYIQKYSHLLESRKIDFVFSEEPLIEAAAKADFILYSQSSTAPKFILAGIPTLQIAPSSFEDVLVKNGIIASVQTTESFIRELGTATADEEMRKKTLFALGIADDWKARLIQIIKGV